MKAAVMFVLIWGLPGGERVYADGLYATQAQCFMAGLTVPKPYKVYRCKRVER